MQRVLCILSEMNVGGAETFLMKIYRQLDKSKYQMDFCVNSFERCDYDDEIEALGGRIYRIPAKTKNLKQFRKQLSYIVKEGRYQSVLRITSNCAGFMDLMLAKKAGATKCCARSSNSSDGHNFLSMIAHMFGRLLYQKYVDVCIAPSDLSAIYTFGKKEYNSGNVNILNNAIDTNVFYFSLNARKEFRNELSIPENDLVLGHVGRFSAQKNHEFLIEIFENILMARNDAWLILVGRGENENSIKNLVNKKGLSERVFFLGVRDDIPRILSGIDTFVFPSLYEGMPNAVIEAQATGLPCYISDTITKEADITGLVNYLPLDNIDLWIDAILNTDLQKRINTEDLIKRKGYDIQSQTQKFIELIYTE